MVNCCCKKDEAVKEKARKIIAAVGGSAGSADNEIAHSAASSVEKEKTIPILQSIQKSEGYIPEELLTEISNLTGIAVSDFYGAATFYSQFRFTPLGKYLIKMCNGTACYVSGADVIYDAVSSFLNIKTGETTDDKLFTLESVACLGCCSLAPVVMVGAVVYGKQTPDKIKKILDKIRKTELSIGGAK